MKLSLISAISAAILTITTVGSAKQSDGKYDPNGRYDDDQKQCFRKLDGHKIGYLCEDKPFVPAGKALKRCTGNLTRTYGKDWSVSWDLTCGPWHHIGSINASGGKADGSPITVVSE